jgi:hypothetical protein
MDDIKIPKMTLPTILKAIGYFLVGVWLASDMYGKLGRVEKDYYPMNKGIVLEEKVGGIESDIGEMKATQVKTNEKLDRIIELQLKGKK